jgi:hypothetical protein
MSRFHSDLSSFFALLAFDPKPLLFFAQVVRYITMEKELANGMPKPFLDFILEIAERVFTLVQTILQEWTRADIFYQVFPVHGNFFLLKPNPAEPEPKKAYCRMGEFSGNPPNPAWSKGSCENFPLTPAPGGEGKNKGVRAGRLERRSSFNRLAKGSYFEEGLTWEREEWEEINGVV